MEDLLRLQTITMDYWRFHPQYIQRDILAPYCVHVRAWVLVIVLSQRALHHQQSNMQHKHFLIRSH